MLKKIRVTGVKFSPEKIHSLSLPETVELDTITYKGQATVYLRAPMKTIVDLAQIKRIFKARGVTLFSKNTVYKNMNAALRKEFEVDNSRYFVNGAQVERYGMLKPLSVRG